MQKKGMGDFRIVPVVDLKDGVAVHAIKGQRNRYSPVTCDWCSNGDIVALLKGYTGIYGLQDLYIADLDAITSDTLNYDVYPKILEIVQGKIMFDAGVTSVEKFTEITRLGFHEIILGTESISSLNSYKEITEKGENVIISIDMKDEKMISPIPELSSRTPIEAIELLDSFNPAAFIFLDLAKVGAKSGLSNLAKQIPDATNIPVYLGGGIKTMKDIKGARDTGFKGVLIATALQEKLIRPKEMLEFL